MWTARSALHQVTKSIHRARFNSSKIMAQQPHIVVLGGAYAGLSALKSLISFSSGEIPEEGKGGPGGPRGKGPGGPSFDVSSLVSRPLKNKPRYTLIDERDGFFHSVGAPLGQISSDWAPAMWVRYDEASWLNADNNIMVVQGNVSQLDMANKKISITAAPALGKELALDYDYLLVATGMRRGAPAVPQSLLKDEYLEVVEQFENELSKHDKIVVVGGGAVGIEMAAEVKKHFPSTHVVLIHSRDKLLNAEPLSDEFKAKALQIITEEGVEVILGQRVLEEQDSESGKVLHLSNGNTIQCGKVIYSAVQQGANTDFLPRDILDDKGCIVASNSLQFPSESPNHSVHYAAGDVVSGPFIKRSGPAQMMGAVAATNIIASLLAAEEGQEIESSKLRTWSRDGTPTMSLAIGTQAVAARPPNGNLIWGKEVKQRAFGDGLGIEGTRMKLKLPVWERKVVKQQSEERMAANM